MEKFDLLQKYLSIFSNLNSHIIYLLLKIISMGQAGSRRAREKFDLRNTIPRLRDAIGYSAE